MLYPFDIIGTLTTADSISFDTAPDGCSKKSFWYMGLPSVSVFVLIPRTVYRFAVRKYLSSRTFQEKWGNNDSIEDHDADRFSPPFRPLLEFNSFLQKCIDAVLNMERIQER